MRWINAATMGAVLTTIHAAPCAAQRVRPAASITLRNGTIAVRGVPGAIEITASKPRGLAPPLAAVLTSLGLSAANLPVRAYLDPDSVTRLLNAVDSLGPLVFPRGAPSQQQAPLLRTGAASGFQLEIRPVRAALGGRQYEIAARACGDAVVWDYADSVAGHAFLQGLRDAVRNRRGRAAPPPRTSVCAARPLPGTTVPILRLFEHESAAPLDVDAIADVDSIGQVRGFEFLRKRKNVPSLLDSTIRRWRFDPARSIDGAGRTSRVRLRFRYRGAPEIADSLTAARLAAFADSIQYLVIGRYGAPLVPNDAVVDGVTLHVIGGGPRTGAGVVVVPTVGGSAAQWSAVLDVLQEDRFALAYDLRGHGPSGDAGPYDIDTHARDLLALLHHERIERAVVVGEGTGATIALEAARREPQRVVGLVLMMPAGDYASRPRGLSDVLDSVRKFMAQPDSVSPLAAYFVPSDSLLRRRIESDIRATRPAAIEGTIASAKSYAFTPALEAYTGQVLLILPSSAPLNLINPPFGSDSASRAAHLGNVAVVRAASGRRWLQLAAPADVAGWIESFAYVVERGGPR